MARARSWSLYGSSRQGQSLRNGLRIDDGRQRNYGDIELGEERGKVDVERCPYGRRSSGALVFHVVRATS